MSHARYVSFNTGRAVRLMYQIESDLLRVACLTLATFGTPLHMFRGYRAWHCTGNLFDMNSVCMRLLGKTWPGLGK